MCFHLAVSVFSIDDSDWPGERKNQLVLIGKTSTTPNCVSSCGRVFQGRGQDSG